MNVLIAVAQNEREYAYCVALRAMVFVGEQGCDLGGEFDEFEGEAVHYLMTLDKKPIASARYRMVADDTAKVERIVVLKDHRGKGHGKVLVSHVTDELKSNAKIKKIVMSAQDYVLPFYEKIGYSSVGKGYKDHDGIPHHKIEMCL